MCRDKEQKLDDTIYLSVNVTGNQHERCVDDQQLFPTVAPFSRSRSQRFTPQGNAAIAKCHVYNGLVVLTLSHSVYVLRV